MHVTYIRKSITVVGALKTKEDSHGSASLFTPFTIVNIPTIMDSPFDLPENIYNNGLCLPRWDQSNEMGRKSEFDPSDLIAAISVCRAWRKILTPIL